MYISLNTWLSLNRVYLSFSRDDLKSLVAILCSLFNHEPYLSRKPYDGIRQCLLKKLPWNRWKDEAECTYSRFSNRTLRLLPDIRWGYLPILEQIQRNYSKDLSPGPYWVWFETVIALFKLKLPSLLLRTTCFNRRVIYRPRAQIMLIP